MTVKITIDVVEPAKYGCMVGLVFFAGDLYDLMHRDPTERRVKGEEIAVQFISRVTKGALIGVFWPITFPYYAIKEFFREKKSSVGSSPWDSVKDDA